MGVFNGYFCCSDGKLEIISYIRVKKIKKNASEIKIKEQAIVKKTGFFNK